MAGRMTVGKRIGLGFTAVIVIAMVLGGLGVWNMLIAKDDSTKLASEYVPEVKVATDLRGAANRVMYQMRGYGLTEEDQYYSAAQQEMVSLNKHLEEASDLAERAVYLKALKGQVTQASGAVANYAKLMQDTETTIAAMAAQRTKLDENAASYMRNCADFLQGQNEAFKQDLDGRQTKVALVTALVDRGTTTRVQNFKAQGTNDMNLMQEAVANIHSIQTEIDQLRPITTDQEDIERIDKTEAAAKKYAQAMESYIATNEKMALAGEKMNANAAAYMENCSAFLDTQNQKMQEEFSKEGANLPERLQKITLVNNIIDLGNEVRVMNFRAQASQDADLMKQAIERLASLRTITGELRNITRQAANRQEIDTVEKAGATYAEAMQDYLNNHLQLGTYREEMNAAAGQYVSNCQAFLEGQQEKLAADMRERHEKITLVNDIVDLGNDARVKAFKSQALRSPQFIHEALENFPKLDKKYAALREITHLEEDLKRIDNTKASGDQYASTLNNFLKQWETLQDIGKQREVAAAGVVDACKATADAGMTATEEISQQAAASLSRNSTIMIVGLAVGTLIAIISALWIARSITGPLSRIIAGLNEGADQVNDAAGQVSGASQQLASGASEQASALEQTSAALEEMAAMTRTNAENAQEANSLSGQARDAAQNGDRTMNQLNSAMAAINESSGQISKIIKVIEEIAFQTNLLALNAAVEAARAGEHGKGFAVVADEVRNLAQRAAQAARETTGLIETSVERAKEGTDVAAQVGEALGTIAGDVTKVTDLINGIAQASQEQAQGVDQVNTAVSQMDKVTQQNASGAEESASAAEELSAQAATVKTMVDELSSMVGGSNGQKSNEHLSSRVKKPARGISRPLVPATAGAGSEQARTPANASRAGSNDEFLAMNEDSELAEF